MTILETLLLFLLVGVFIFCVLIYKKLSTLSRVELVLDRFTQAIQNLDRGLKEQERFFNDKIAQESRLSRDELKAGLKGSFDSILKQLSEMLTIQTNQLETIRTMVDQRLKSLQTDNNQKLDQMRHVVDEKLQVSLEKRLGESFKLVSDRLEHVHKGLGEMHSLASGVGDLKKVLTNVKTRGVWGEIQLGALLEQLLTPDQYEQNVKVKPRTLDHVEFAIKLPGRDQGQKQIWLPIDAKFPQEPYQRLIEAQERSDASLVELETRQLEMTLKKSARQIRDKYISPPSTTDFAILFLPIEGLYAEALRIPGLQSELQDSYRVVLSGPATLSALLNSLQMGFRTLAIEKRSSEVWSVLGTIKTEFSKFGDILEKTQKKLQEAGNTIESAAQKSRNIERKLNRVERLSEEKVMIQAG